MKDSKLSKEESTTIEYYNKNAKEWTKKHFYTGKGKIFGKYFNKYFNLLPKGRVLEIGTGHGGDAKTLISHYGADNYVGCDPAEGLLNIAKERNPNADLRNYSTYNLEFNKDSFDGFWTSATLIHIPRNEIKKALNNIHKVVKQDGIGFISILEGDDDMIKSRTGRYFTLWKSDKFIEELSDSGFEVLLHERINTKHSPWLVYLVRVTK